MTDNGLDPALIDRLVGAALDEDRAREDITTVAVVPAEQRGRAIIIAKDEGFLAGIALAETAFAAIDPSLVWQAARRDGDHLSPGDCIAGIEGALASILRAERVALNFLSHVSGVATATNAVVRALEGANCRLRDTRKTTPGLRTLEKYAVRVGGGANHRMDLAAGVLIKDNHIAALRARGVGIADAVRLAREANAGMRIEIEVTDLDEAREALASSADELLLDNMSLEAMREVVALAKGEAVLEASGGITLENARAVAETGVDYISMGAITHSATAVDMSLEVVVG
jgi:nicotinate-nucleotide pyrophosphorylase (carboxylating)